MPPVWSANKKLAMPVGQLVFQCEIRIRASLYEACMSADALVDSEAIGLPGAVDEFAAGTVWTELPKHFAVCT